MGNVELPTKVSCNEEHNTQLPSVNFKNTELSGAKVAGKCGKKVPTRTRSQLNLAEPRLLRVKAFVAVIHGFITPLAPCFASPIAGMSRSPSYQKAKFGLKQLFA